MFTLNLATPETRGLKRCAFLSRNQCYSLLIQSRRMPVLFHANCLILLQDTKIDGSQP